jgi:hypothetical protein
MTYRQRARHLYGIFWTSKSSGSILIKMTFFFFLVRTEHHVPGDTVHAEFDRLPTSARPFPSWYGALMFPRFGLAPSLAAFTVHLPT